MRYFTGILLGGFFLVRGFAAVPGDLSADSVRTHLRNALAPVAQLLREDTNGRSAQVYLTNQRLIVDAIQPYLYSGGQGDLSRNSPIRDARVAEVEAWLAPYESVLITATERSATQTSFPNAAVDLLLFTRPSEALKYALQEVAHSATTKPDRAVDAYNTLFMLQLDDSNVRKEVLNAISWRGERSTRAGLGRQLLQRAANRWGLREMESLYQDFLSIAFTPENYPTVGGRGSLLAQYRAAIAGLSALGTEARSYVDLIEARMAEMNSNNEDEASFIRSASEALEILQGKRVPAVAVSWKGQLLGVSKRTYPQWLSKQPSGAGLPAPPVTGTRETGHPQKDPGGHDKPAEATVASQFRPQMAWLAVTLVLVGVLWFGFGRSRK